MPRKGTKAGSKPAAKAAAKAADKPADKVADGMAEAFDRAQRSAVNHAKATATLFAMLTEATQTDEGGQGFHDAFLAAFSRALVVFKREQAVERVIDFAVKFVAQAEKVRVQQGSRLAARGLGLGAQRSGFGAVCAPIASSDALASHCALPPPPPPLLPPHRRAAPRRRKTRRARRCSTQRSSTC